MVLTRDEILTYYPDAKQANGNTFQYKCRAHDDRKASGTLTFAEDKALVYCHAGCRPEDDLEKRGLTVRDLFYDDEKPETGQERQGKPKVTATYRYTDEHGKLIAEKQRRDDKSFLWRHRGPDGQWVYRKPKQTIPPYNLPAIITADTVLVVEGEKDCRTCEKYGKVATTGPDGAGPGKWKDHNNKWFEGKSAVVVADNDDVGRAYAAEVADALHGIAASVKLLDLCKVYPSLPEHGDISDVLALMGQDGMDEIQRYIAHMPEYRPEQSDAIRFDDDNETPDDGGKPTQAGALLKLVERSGTQFFHTDSGDPYAAIAVGGHNEVWPLDGKSFRVWLSGLYYKSTQKPINGDAVKQVVDTLTAKALFDNLEPVALHTRTARHSASFWYDLTDPDWQAIEITPDRWRVVNNPPLLFNRYGHQTAQPIPVPGGDVTKILEYVPLKDQTILFLCWLTSCFIPGIPHPMPVFYGEKGAAKSTTCELLKSLIDPSALKTMTLTNDERTLAVNLQQHWFLPFDNVSFISESTSDTLCRAVTGGGIQQRKLHTNADDVIFQFQRCLAINGINNVATRADLLDRSILMELQRIPEDERRELSGIQEAFDHDKAAILGGILDTLADAMRIHPTVKLQRLPRMADFTTWGYAIGQALGNCGDKFLEEYAANRSTQNIEAIANDPVATLIVAFMEDRAEWYGTSTELFKSLESIAPDHGVSTRSKSFPPDPTRLSKRLTGIRSNLEGAGIAFDRGKSGSRNISFKRQNLASVASIASKPA